MTLLLMVLIAVTATACQASRGGGLGQGKDQGPKVVDLNTYRQMFTAVQKEHTLPSGFAWPDPPKQEPGTHFQEGVARGQVESYWACAWETEWLEWRNKDAKRAAVAFNVIKNEVPRSRMMTEYSDQSVRDFYADALKKAELGDPSGIQKDIELNGFVPRRTK